MVWKHLVVHPQQVAVAHLAACAAARQGKFHDFYKAWWAGAYKPYVDAKDASLLGEDNVYKLAGEIGLDVARLKADVPGCRQVIEADEEELRRFKVNGTPAFFINGEFFGGGIPKEKFKQVIDQKLAIAEKSGVPGAAYYDKEIRGKGEHEVKRPARPAPAKPTGH